MGFKQGSSASIATEISIESADSYKLWERDHLIPRACGGAEDDLDNLALACSLCNVKYKNRWDPREPSANNRPSLIAATRAWPHGEQKRKDNVVKSVA